MPTTLVDVNLNNLVVVTVSLQLAFFGWRLVREIAVGDKEEEKGKVWRTWVPWPDRVNLASLLLVTTACVIAPLIMGRFTVVSRAVLVSAVVLWMCHPLSVACHYALFRGGRRIVYGEPDKWPKATLSEGIVLLGSVLLALSAGFLAWCVLAR